MISQTERLILRNLNADDLEELFDYRNAEACSRFQRWEDTSKEYLKTFIDRYQKDIFLSDAPQQHYAISLKNGRLIGDIAYFYNAAEKCITLGYTISYRYHRQGFAFEILSALIPEIQRSYPDFELVALVEGENLPSIGLLQKLGFHRECYAEKIHSWIYCIPPAVKPETKEALLQANHCDKRKI